MSLDDNQRAVTPSRRELELARVADAAGDPLEAIRHYAAGLPSNEAEVDDFLNLAVLYMSCGDFGFASHHKISPQLFNDAGSLALEVLREARVRFPAEPEIEFWMIYVTWILLGAELDLPALNLLAQDRNAPIVFLVLVQIDPSAENTKGASALLDDSRHRTSERARYVTSVLESVLAA